MQKHLRAFLLADSTLADLIEQRIYPLHLPQKPTLPAISYQVVSAASEYLADVADSERYQRVQLDCWATSYAGAQSLAAALRRSLDGYRGSMGDSTIYAAFLSNWLELYEDGLDAYRVTLDFELYYPEA